jgi:hypothetical protein
MMHGDDPDQATGVEIHAKRRVVVQRLLEDLSRREVLALAASVPMKFRWASLGPDSGLTEDQEDFVDYWAPELVLAECRATRELICALDEWALTAASPADQEFVSYLLSLVVTDAGAPD